MVGIKYPPNDGTYDRPFDYKDIIKNDDGWIDSKKYLPREYDIVLVKVDGLKPYPGWYSGSGWDGARYRKWHTIRAWKKDKSLFNYDII